MSAERRIRSFVQVVALVLVLPVAIGLFAVAAFVFVAGRASASTGFLLASGVGLLGIALGRPSPSVTLLNAALGHRDKAARTISIPLPDATDAAVAPLMGGTVTDQVA